jgi:sphingolipid delta-4 desaturase
MANYFQNLDWIYFTISSYLFGGSIIHTNFLLIHDLTHNTCFENLYLNKILAVFTNLPLVIPLAISFGRYHYDHHAYMNIYEFDPDIPS